MTPKKYRLLQNHPYAGAGTTLQLVGTSTEVFRAEENPGGLICIPLEAQSKWLEEIDGKWRPSNLMRYFFPFPTDFNEPYDEAIWESDHIDHGRFEANLVCRTREEAVAKAEKMLEAIKEI